MPNLANLAGMAGNNARTAEGYRAGAAANAPTPEDWQYNKATIQKLYVDDDRPLKEVRQIMEDRSFLATERMFKQRLKEWGFDRKKVKAAEWRYMLRITLQRRAEGKETAFQVHGKPIVWSNIRKHLKRKKKTEDEFLATGPDPEGIEGSVQCFTPLGSPSLPMSQTLSPQGPMSAHQPAFSPERPSQDWHGSSPPYPYPYPYHTSSYLDQPRSPTAQISAAYSSYSTTAASSRRPSMLVSAPSEYDSYPDPKLQKFTLYWIRKDQDSAKDDPLQPIPEEDILKISRLLSGKVSEEDSLSSLFGLVNLNVSVDPAKPATDEELASQWIVSYFRACIAQCQNQQRSKFEHMAEGAKAFGCMLDHANPYLLTGLTLMISILYYHGHKEICIEFLRESCAHMARQTPGNTLLHPYRYMLGCLEDTEEDNQDMLANLKWTWSGFKLSWGPHAAPTLSAMYYYGWCQQRSGEYEKAKEMLLECLRLSEGHIGKSHLLTIWTLATLARTLNDGPWGNKLKAMEKFEQAIDRCRNVMPKEHPYALELTAQLAQLHCAVRNYPQAEICYTAVLEGQATVFGLDHQKTQSTLKELSDVLRWQNKNLASCHTFARLQAREARGEHSRVLGISI